MTEENVSKPVAQPETKVDQTKTTNVVNQTAPTAQTAANQQQSATPATEQQQPAVGTKKTGCSCWLIGGIILAVLAILYFVVSFFLPIGNPLLILLDIFSQ